MAKRLSVLGTSALALLLSSVSSFAATAARVITSDERGVTLRVEVPAWRLETSSPGIQRLVVNGFDATDVPGRAAMPFASVLVGLPPGARATARVEEEDPWKDLGKSALEIVGKPGFQGDQPGDLQPIRTPVPAIQDGPWPSATVEAG